MTTNVLSAAALLSVQELVYGSAEKLPFPVLDLAWPLSHTFMLVTGGFALAAGVWKGWRRFAPFLPGLKIPLLFALMALGVGNAQGAAGYIHVSACTIANLTRRARP